MEGTMPQPMSPPEKASGMATAALILSIAGIFCCGVASIIGLILGIIELGKINRGESSERGRGYAKAAIIISVVAIALGVIVNIILVAVGGWSFNFSTGT